MGHCKDFVYIVQFLVDCFAIVVGNSVVPVVIVLVRSVVELACIAVVGVDLGGYL